MGISREVQKEQPYLKKKETSCHQELFVSHLSALCQGEAVVTSCGATHPCSNTLHLFPPPLCIHGSQGDSSQG